MTAQQQVNWVCSRKKSLENWGRGACRPPAESRPEGKVPKEEWAERGRTQEGGKEWKQPEKEEDGSGETEGKGAMPQLPEEAPG